MDENFQGYSESKDSFDIPPELLDEIQRNIEEIITSFPVPEDNKLDVIKKINFMYSHTRHMSLTDGLTGLYNRRHFDSMVEREFLRSKRYDGDLSLAIVDIAFFKKINDKYGHLCGDYVLKEVAYMILDNFRKTDLVFRYGGEEFVVLLTETDINGSVVPLERLRKRIEEYPFKFNGEGLKLTISIGVADNLVESTQELIDNADKALYEAKGGGRNRVIVFNNKKD